MTKAKDETRTIELPVESNVPIKPLKLGVSLNGKLLDRVVLDKIKVHEDTLPVEAVEWLKGTYLKFVKDGAHVAFYSMEESREKWRKALDMCASIIECELRPKPPKCSGRTPREQHNLVNCANRINEVRRVIRVHALESASQLVIDPTVVIKKSFLYNYRFADFSLLDNFIDMFKDNDPATRREVSRWYTSAYSRMYQALQKWARKNAVLLVEAKGENRTPDEKVFAFDDGSEVFKLMSEEGYVREAEYMNVDIDPFGTPDLSVYVVRDNNGHSKYVITCYKNRVRSVVGVNDVLLTEDDVAALWDFFTSASLLVLNVPLAEPESDDSDDDPADTDAVAASRGYDFDQDDDGGQDDSVEAAMEEALSS